MSKPVYKYTDEVIRNMAVTSKALNLAREELMGSFLFNESPQGAEYWAGVIMNLEEIETAYSAYQMRKREK